MQVSIGYVNKVVQDYVNNMFLPLTRKLATRNVVTQDVVDYIESEKLCKPSTYTSELQQRILLDGVSPPHLLPSQSAIKKSVWEDCFMTKTKLRQLPTESLSDVNINYKDYFLDQIAQLDSTRLHFFDESSVNITSGNHVYISRQVIVSRKACVGSRTGEHTKWNGTAIHQS